METRQRVDFVSGVLDQPMPAIGGIMISTGLVDLPPIVPDPETTTAIVIDPHGEEPEIVWVDRHYENAPNATVLRGRENTHSKEWDKGTFWHHGPTVKDWEFAGFADIIFGFHGLLAIGITSPIFQVSQDVLISELFVYLGGPTTEDTVIIMYTSLGYKIAVTIPAGEIESSEILNIEMNEGDSLRFLVDSAAEETFNLVAIVRF